MGSTEGLAIHLLETAAAPQRHIAQRHIAQCAERIWSPPLEKGGACLQVGRGDLIIVHWKLLLGNWKNERFQRSIIVANIGIIPFTSLQKTLPQSPYRKFSAKPAREKFLAQSQAGKFLGTESWLDFLRGKNFGSCMEGGMCEKGSSYIYTAINGVPSVGFACWDHPLPWDSALSPFWKNSGKAPQ